jgi:hypothetical protein
MTPTPPWIIEELERMRREREAQDRPVLRIEDHYPAPRVREEERAPVTSGPIVIEF